MLIAGLSAARAALDHGVCSDHSASPITSGSATVLINHRHAARHLDRLHCKAHINDGCVTVYIGGPDVSPSPCNCDQPKDNFPYADETFEYIRKIAPHIRDYSIRNHVSPIAVAGSIADEYNSLGLKDWFQREIFFGLLWDERKIQQHAKAGHESKLRNATINDLGPGNIQLNTAREMYDKYPDQFTGVNGSWTSLVDYLQDDKGTAHVASLYIRQADDEVRRLLDEYGQNFDDYPLQDREGLLVTYYKQGPETMFSQARMNLNKDADYRLRAGEGCRACLQRERLLEALFGVRDDPKP